MPTKRELARAVARNAEVLGIMVERLLPDAEVVNVEARAPSARQPSAAPWRPLADRERRRAETFRAMNEVASRRLAREVVQRAAMLERLRPSRRCGTIGCGDRSRSMTTAAARRPLRARTARFFPVDATAPAAVLDSGACEPLTATVGGTGLDHSVARFGDAPH
ncbi:hypothetical protein ACT4MK_01200 (plasmid) [Bradyrhizobium barranii]|uniref:hypothetical protein n=1 Tax=Bradyrhizobium TaxID=374 RepID=UPI003F209B67